jgi:hypothetical protein
VTGEIVPECHITTVSQQDIESLSEYLLQEGLTGVRPSLGPGEARPGEQGATEILTVLFTSGSGMALAQAVSAWIRTRQKKVVLTVRRTADGAEASLESTGPTADADLRAFLTGRADETSPGSR